MSIFFMRSSPASLRFGIIVFIGLECLNGNADQPNDTFSGHSASGGVPMILKPKTLKWLLSSNSTGLCKVKQKGKLEQVPKNFVQLISFTGSREKRL